MRRTMRRLRRSAATRAAPAWRHDRRGLTRCASPTSSRRIRRSPSQPFVVNEMIEVQDAGPRAWSCCRSTPGEPGGVRHGTFERLRPAAVLPPALCDAATAALAAVGAAAPPVARAADARRAAPRGGRRACGRTCGSLAVTPKALAAALAASRASASSTCTRTSPTRRPTARRSPAASRACRSRSRRTPTTSTRRRPRQRNETLDWKLRARGARVRGERLRARPAARAAAGRRARARVARRTSGIPTALFRAEPPPPDGGRLRLALRRALPGEEGPRHAARRVRRCCAIAACAFHLTLIGDGPERARAGGAGARALALEDAVELPGPRSAGGGGARR